MKAGDLRLPAVERVGYIRGASDRVPEALRQVGVPVEVLSAEALSVGDLEEFDTIVVGSRAYETDSTLGRANGRLLEYVRQGGTLIVQYQQYQFVRGGFAPFPPRNRPASRTGDRRNSRRRGSPSRSSCPDHSQRVDGSRLGGLGAGAGPLFSGYLGCGLSARLGHGGFWWAAAGGCFAGGIPGRGHLCLHGPRFFSSVASWGHRSLSPVSQSLGAGRLAARGSHAISLRARPSACAATGRSPPRLAPVLHRSDARYTCRETRLPKFWKNLDSAVRNEIFEEV